ncbi:MAG: hypothetical protein H7A24_12300 [Leptospiraceae bacterium]|nr:hypothetical protein [Leptospiraceae bacterium]MCP5512656.1 hypothetical protein [Leptospiraceae bacterium]
MKYAYLIWGSFLCFSLLFSNIKGFSYMDFISSGGKWGPKGRSTYHK